MSILEIAAAPVPEPQTTEEDLNHEVCCVDENLTLCGRDATGMDWVDPGATNCMMCILLDAEWEIGDEVPPASLAEPPCRICPRRFQEANL